jgi:hypothetical protein
MRIAEDGSMRWLRAVSGVGMGSGLDCWAADWIGAVDGFDVAAVVDAA